MNQHEKNELLEVIKNHIVKTEKDILDLKEMTKPISPDVSIGRISRMDAINNKSITDASLFSSENKLVRLKNALININNEDFGLCIKCRKSIPIERLRIIPDSLKCVNCQ